MYRESIYVKSYTEETWKKLREKLEIYEIQLPKSYKSLPIGKEDKWEAKEPTTSWRSRDKANILEVVEVWTNLKNTVKIALLGKERQIIILSRNFQGEGFLGINLDKYNETPSDIFDNLHKGTWVVAYPRYSSSSEELVAFISNESSSKNVKRILETLSKINSLKQKYGEFSWKDEAKVESYGTVTLMEVLLQEGIFLKALRRFRWVKRKMRWDLWNSVKANITFSKSPTNLRVQARALDGNTYLLECPIVQEEEMVGWNDSSLYVLDFWLPFVFRKPRSRFLLLSNSDKTQELMNQCFLPIKSKIPKASFTLGLNRRRLKVSRKIAKNGAVLNYLNGSLVKADDVSSKIKDYLTLGKPIVAYQPRKRGKSKRKVFSEEAQKLIDAGLNGILRDLEGELPFHLNILYKEKERKWYLEIAGKEYYVKGGYNSLSKVKSAIEGRAILRHKEEGYDGRQTNVIRGRLAELVGDKNALEIILNVKRMGALVKVIAK